MTEPTPAQRTANGIQKLIEAVSATALSQLALETARKDRQTPADIVGDLAMDYRKNEASMHKALGDLVALQVGIMRDQAEAVR